MFSAESRDMNFPRRHTHRLAVHRHELMETFCEARYIEYWKMAMKTTTEAKRAIDADDNLSDEEKKTKFEQENKELIAKAAAKVGSISEIELDIRFNSDIFSDTVTHVIDETERFSL